jgi:hypothetical protein
VEEGVHFMAARKQREIGGDWTRYNLQRHAPKDLLPPARSHLLKFPPALRVAPPAGTLFDISDSNPNTK